MISPYGMMLVHFLISGLNADKILLLIVPVYASV